MGIIIIALFMLWCYAACYVHITEYVEYCTLLNKDFLCKINIHVGYLHLQNTLPNNTNEHQHLLLMDLFFDFTLFVIIEFMGIGLSQLILVKLSRSSK